MTQDMETRYAERLNRYVTALRNERPDRVPIRPFVAEYTAKFAGMTCQEVSYDYEKAFEAARRCAAHFDWDAVVSSMVYVWTGLTEALGLKYYAVPGLDLDPMVGFQYREPPEERAFMRADEYDRFIDDPTAFLYEVWLPRVTAHGRGPGEASSFRHVTDLVKGAMSMAQYFYAFPGQNDRLRTESGTVSAIAGIFKAPFDILADKLRGYLGLTMDMHERPEKVLAACEALMPHLTHVARTTADPARLVPVGFWMHRGCVPFISPAWFESHYWPTLKPVVESLWADGHQVLFYAEGSWDHHLDRFAELPERSIVFHVDQGDLALAHEKLGHRFCLSGGIPNALLSFGTPDRVRAKCREVLEVAAKDGGYILDASAIMQNDTRTENLEALTDFAREHGVYSGAPTGGVPSPDTVVPPSGHGNPSPAPVESGDSSGAATASPFPDPRITTSRPPGICVPWSEHRAERGAPRAGEEMMRGTWESLDGWGYVFIWQCLLSF